MEQENISQRNNNNFAGLGNKYEVPDKTNWHIDLKFDAVYTETDKIFSVIALILGFIFLKVMIHFDYIGFIASFLCVGLTLFNWFYLKNKGLNVSKENATIFFITLALSLLFVISDNIYIKHIDFWLTVVSNLYFVYASYKPNRNSIILNVFKAVCLSPFYEYESLFSVLFHKRSKNIKSKNSQKNNMSIMPIILGLMLSIPVCAVVVILLISSDKNFGRIFDVFDHNLEELFRNIFVNILYFVFSIPIGMYIFGAVFSRAYKMKNEEKLYKVPKISMRVLPSSMCNAFLFPFIFIYICYVLVQISYLFSTFGILNDNFDYSDYARNGFFELCFVAIINLSVISAIMFFVKLKDSSLPKSVKAFIISFCVLTLCLICTAIIKMMMYINMFGMTPLRIYTSIFMVYLFVMFIVLIFKQFIFKLSFTKIAYCLAAFVLIAMSLLPVDACIAKYNIEKYEQGKISWMGASAMRQLDASAVWVFVEYNDSLKDMLSQSDNEVYQIQTYLEENVGMGNMDIYEFNLTRFFAARQSEEFLYKNN